jgi:Flp pilus assembly protein TadG
MPGSVYMRVVTALRDFLKESHGVAAIEFAITAPVSVALLLAGAELSMAFTAQRRLQKAADYQAESLSKYTVPLQKQDFVTAQYAIPFYLGDTATNAVKMTVSQVVLTPVASDCYISCGSAYTAANSFIPTGFLPGPGPYFSLNCNLIISHASVSSKRYGARKR